jgi:hypothetical protein
MYMFDLRFESAMVYDCVLSVLENE